jgi:hypothetical protein
MPGTGLESLKARQFGMAFDDAVRCCAVVGAATAARALEHVLALSSTTCRPFTFG